MKIIMHCEPEEAGDLLKLILREKPAFERGPERLGYGWHYGLPSGRRFFLRQIKGGISAKPVDPHP